MLAYRFCIVYNWQCMFVIVKMIAYMHIYQCAQNEYFVIVSTENIFDVQLMDPSIEWIFVIISFFNLFL